MSSESLTAVVVSPDKSLQDQLESALSKGALAESVWLVSSYPELPQLERLKQVSGCVLFLDFADLMRARRIATELDRAYPLVSVVAILNSDKKDDLVALMQLGIREVISTPVNDSQVAGAFLRAAKKLRPSESGGGDIYVFLPAKPGAGATTIAISTAAAVARISKQETLLLDFDLRLGITSFLLGLDGRYSVQDALNQAANLDADLLSQLITRRGNLNILGSAPAPAPCDPFPDAYMAVLNCAQAQYATIVVDVLGTLERHELETMERAKEIFMICTPDVTGLHMAKRKAESLQSSRLGDKLTAVINRADKRTMLPLVDIEKLLQVPVRFTLPSDQKMVANAVQLGEPILPGSPLGSQIEAMAKSIVGTAVPNSSTGSVRRFIEFFSVSPTRERHMWKG